MNLFNRKGITPIIFLLIIALVSSTIIGGSIYIKKNNPQLLNYLNRQEDTLSENSCGLKFYYPYAKWSVYQDPPCLSFLPRESMSYQNERVVPKKGEMIIKLEADYIPRTATRIVNGKNENINLEKFEDYLKIFQDDNNNTSNIKEAKYGKYTGLTFILIRKNYEQLDNFLFQNKSTVYRIYWPSSLTSKYLSDINSILGSMEISNEYNGSSDYSSYLKQIDSYETGHGLKQVTTLIQKYYDINDKLPVSLDMIDTKIIEQLFQIKDVTFLKKYEYSPQDDLNYKLCYIFKQPYKEPISPLDEWDNNKGKYSHEAGYQCLSLSVLKRSPKVFPDNISNVTYDFTNILPPSYFPYGFFSSNENEWGLITYATNFINVTVTFKSPVKIKSITNLFTNCSQSNCYFWSAGGSTVNRIEGALLVGGVYTDAYKESKVDIITDDSGKFIQNVRSDDEFQQLTLTAYRENDPKSNNETSKVYWKKIKIEYE